jgi:diketogulonate reductase-like aldo/keto reductase
MHKYMLSQACLARRARLVAGPFTNPKVAAIAKSHGKSVAQVCLRWIVDNKCVMAVGTGSNATTATSYAKENYDIFDFELTTAEMKVLNAI